MSQDLFKSLMLYIGENANTADATKFIDKLKSLASHYQEDIMTIAQQLAEKGKQECKREGELEGKRKVACQLRLHGFDIELIKSVTGLNDEQLTSAAH